MKKNKARGRKAPKAASTKKDSLRVLGVMTGTSCDGLDAACIEITPDGWQDVWSSSAPYPAELRERVLEVQKTGAKRTTRELLEIERDLGDWYGKVLAKMIAKAPAKSRPHLIANHGQTIAHFPAKAGRGPSARQGMTWQMGDPTRIATATGLTVISQFRDGDMSAGGQGAPLAPMFHALLASHLDPQGKGVAFHNIGGISNFTYIGKKKVFAFDTGPGNAWIDAATELATGGRQKIDFDGRLASHGEIDWTAVDRIIAEHPYFNLAPPKSTGRDDFPFEYLTDRTQARGNDLISTATALTVESIAQAYEKWILAKKLPLRAVYVVGGGAKNLSMLSGISQRLPGVQVQALSDLGVDSQLIEAQAFAYFGFLSLLGRPVGGEWTGVQEFGPPGQITPGKNWVEVMEKIRGFVTSA